jgi:NCAIR mutase (PurE)-related protein
MKEILEDYKNGKISLNEVLEKIKMLPYKDLDFAKIDTHRKLRKGYPETILCTGKTNEQIVEIFQMLSKEKHNIIATKANNDVFLAVKKKIPDVKYHKQAKMITLTQEKNLTRKGKILVITAGTSDIPIAQEAVVTAEILGNSVEKCYDVGVAGIHRLFDIKDKIFNANVIIVVAGMEGALASIVGGLTSKPVIAVPTSIGYGASFKGIAPLLTMLNSCAEGVVVVNIDNGFGAGYFASLINR